MTCSSVGAASRLLAAVVVAGLAGPGCGRPPLLVPVKGVVLLDGKPLASGVVQFQPAAGQPASGVIAGDGTFTLSRHSPNDGVPPGTYRVAVTAFDPLAEVQSVENLIVPLKYTRFGSSGIEFTVFPGTLEPLVVSMSSDVEAGMEVSVDRGGNDGGGSTSDSSQHSGDEGRGPSDRSQGGA